MIVKSISCNQRLGKDRQQKNIEKISYKSEQDSNIQSQSFICKKNHLRLLVQKVNLNSIQDMISSPRKRKDSQKQLQNASRKSSTHYSQNSPRSSPDKIKNPFLQFSGQKKAQNGKKSAQVIEKAQQYLEIKIENEKQSLQKIRINLKDNSQATSNAINLNKRSQKSNFNVNKCSLRYETGLQTSYKKSSLIVETLNQIEKGQVEAQNTQFKRDSNLTINDFDEISFLGMGVYGRVSLARHKQTKMLVALKKIQKDNLKVEDSVYLSRQIKIQSFAEHPNIVQLYTFFSDQKNIYLVLEVCNEGNLYEILQKQGGRFSQERTKKYIRQICKAVQFLHNHQIIHRDLKPENILVHNEIAKICDFGWAVHAPQLRHTLCGTPLYSCPEIIKKEKYDSKIDIWNIGIMTYEFLYGKVPFDIKTSDDLHKIVQLDIVFPQSNEISQNCKNFIRGCLEKVPQDRFEIWELLRHPFINVEQKIRQSIRMVCTQYQT